MPLTIEHEGKQVTVFTQEELDTAVAGAKTGLLTEDEAKKMVDSAAAKSRREAETKLKELQDKLAETGQTAEQITALQAQIAEQAGKLAQSERAIKGIKALSKSGLSPVAAEQLLALPALAAANFDDEEETGKAIDGVKSIFPQLFPTAEQKNDGGFLSLSPKGGTGGSPAPAGGIVDNDALSRMSMDEYIKYRSQK